MTLLKELELMNEATISYLKKMNKNTKRNEIIKEILKDEACFFKMDKGDSCIILKDIGISDKNINDTYLQLVSANEYYELQRKGKINEDDIEVKIRYKNYNPEDLF